MLDRINIFAGNKKLTKILKIVRMSAQTLDEVLAKLTQTNDKLDSANASIEGIRADITKIKEGLPAEGGLTADEVATLNAQLDAVLGKATGTADTAAALDAENN